MSEQSPAYRRVMACSRWLGVFGGMVLIVILIALAAGIALWVWRSALAVGA